MINISKIMRNPTIVYMSFFELKQYEAFCILPTEYNVWEYNCLSHHWITKSCYNKSFCESIVKHWLMKTILSVFKENMLLEHGC